MGTMQALALGALLAGGGGKAGGGGGDDGGGGKGGKGILIFMYFYECFLCFIYSLLKISKQTLPMRKRSLLYKDLKSNQNKNIHQIIYIFTRPCEYAKSLKLIVIYTLIFIRTSKICPLTRIVLIFFLFF